MDTLEQVKIASVNRLVSEGADVSSAIRAVNAAIELEKTASPALVRAGKERMLAVAKARNAAIDAGQAAGNKVRYNIGGEARLRTGPRKSGKASAQIMGPVQPNQGGILTPFGRRVAQTGAVATGGALGYGGYRLITGGNQDVEKVASLSRLIAEGYDADSALQAVNYASELEKVAAGKGRGFTKGFSELEKLKGNLPAGPRTPRPGVRKASAQMMGPVQPNQGGVLTPLGKGVLGGAGAVTAGGLGYGGYRLATGGSQDVEKVASLIRKANGY